MIEIVPFAPHHAAGVVAVILPIQQREFEIPITLDAQPDLRDIPGFYQRGRGNFWVAVDEGTVVGTVGLLDIGDGRAALRKMFVSASHRGPAHGVARLLLDALLAWCHAHAVREIYLGTTAKFLAAHRFYEKNGFREIPRDDLPASFPVDGGGHEVLRPRAPRHPAPSTSCDCMSRRCTCTTPGRASSPPTSGGAGRRRASSSGERARATSGAFARTCREDLTRALEDLCNDEPVAAELPRTPLHQAGARPTAGDASSHRADLGGARLWFRGAHALRAVGRSGSTLRTPTSCAAAWKIGSKTCRTSSPSEGVIEEGRVVSLCASVRITGAAHAAGVETLPAFRRRGHAADVVAGWAAAVRGLGAVPLYSTSWDNTASRSVAASLGMSLFGADFHVT